MSARLSFPHLAEYERLLVAVFDHPQVDERDLLDDVQKALDEVDELRETVARQERLLDERNTK